MERDSDSEPSPNAGRNRGGRRRRNPSDPRRAAPTSNTGQDLNIGSDSDSNSSTTRKPPKNKDPKKPKPGKGCKERDRGGKNNDGSGKPPGSQGTPGQNATGFRGTSYAYGAETQHNESSQGRGGAEGNQRSAVPYENYYGQQSSYSAYRDNGFQGSAYDLQSTPDFHRPSMVERPPYSATPRTSEPLSADEFAQYTTPSEDTAAFPVNQGYYNHVPRDGQSRNTKGWNVHGSHDH